PRLRSERGEVEVAEWTQGSDVGGRHQLRLVQDLSRARVDWEDDPVSDTAEAVEDPLQSFRHGVRLSVDGRDDVAAPLEVERLEDVRAFSCERREAEQRIEHHVPNDLPLPGHTFGVERLCG